MTSFSWLFIAVVSVRLQVRSRFEVLRIAQRLINRNVAGCRFMATFEPFKNFLLIDEEPSSGFAGSQVSVGQLTSGNHLVNGRIAPCTDQFPTLGDADRRQARRLFTGVRSWKLLDSAAHDAFLASRCRLNSITSLRRNNRRPLLVLRYRASRPSSAASMTAFFVIPTSFAAL